MRFFVGERAGLVGMAGVLVLTVLAFACGTSDSAIEENDGGASSGASGASGGVDSSSGMTTDGAPPGCVTVGPNKAKSAVSKPREGVTTVAWTAPENVLVQDDVRATAILSEATPATEELHVTGFGFSVPDGARIAGVDVALRRQSPDIGTRDDEVKLITNGMSVGRFKFTKSPWPSSAPGTHHYGGPNDAFAAELKGADVNREDFGASFSAKLDTGAISGDPAIDYIEVKVTYCP